MKLALVSTFIRATTVLTAWVAHHRALGVQQFYLFVDDPAELAGYAALQLGDDACSVQLITRDASLLAPWRTTRDFDYHGQFIERQVYSRQCLNTNIHIERAGTDGVD